MTPLNHPLNIILLRKMKNIFTDCQEGSMNFSEVGWCNPEKKDDVTNFVSEIKGP